MWTRMLVALMALQSEKPIQTFSIGFQDDALYDETRYARDVARKYRTDHQEFKLTFQDMMDVLPEDATDPWFKGQRINRVY